MESVVMKTNFRHGNNDSLRIIAGPSDYVKESVRQAEGQRNKNEKTCMACLKKLETTSVERLL